MTAVDNQGRPAPDHRELEAAAERLDGRAHRTPILTSSQLDDRVGASIFLKCENFQRIGAFKFRGAYNAISSVDENERGQGFVTHSSGNHAQALSLAAKLFGVPATIVMPTNAPAVKKAAVLGYGARVVGCEPTLKSRQDTADDVLRENGGHFVSPFDDARVIAGQSTVVRELMEDVPDLDYVLVPVGGGGLASGAVLSAEYSAKQSSTRTRVIGCEPAGADDAARSLETGIRQAELSPQTVCDGLRTSLSELTFSILNKALDGIARVQDEDTISAMRFLFERLKLVVEPSGAITSAALFGPLAAAGYEVAGRRIGVVISGGNVDLDRLPWLPTKTS